MAEPWQPLLSGAFDLADGLPGPGVYALERLREMAIAEGPRAAAVRPHPDAMSA